MTERHLKTVDAHDARVHFGRLLDEVDRGEARFFVRRRGRVVAVVMSPDDYLDLQEVVREEANPAMRRSLRESRKQFELGEVGTEADIFRILRGEDEV